MTVYWEKIRTKRWIAALLAVLLFLAGCGENISENRKAEKPESNDLKITMLDVGQGLSILLESEGQTALYDGGDREHSSFVVSYLKERGISEVDYLFASHYDEDHIAGLVGVLKTASVKRAVIPEYQAETDIYSSFMEAAASADTVTYAESGLLYELGDAEIKVLYAGDGTEASENDRSTVLKITCGDFSCLLSGDAETETEEKLLESSSDLKSTVYVVGHHGSSSSSSEEFVKTIAPTYALISVGSDNEYGHPTEKTLNTLINQNCEIYRTDQQGTVCVEYKEGKITVETEREEKTRSFIDDQEKQESGFVLNTSSKKFHLPNCEAVKKMAEHNKAYSAEARANLMEDGYSPCGICNP